MIHEALLKLAERLGDDDVEEQRAALREFARALIPFEHVYDASHVLEPFAVNPARQEITLLGVRYSVALFRALAHAPLGTWLRIDARTKDNLVQVTQPGEQIARRFDLILASTTAANQDRRH